MAINVLASIGVGYLTYQIPKTILWLTGPHNTAYRTNLVFQKFGEGLMAIRRGIAYVIGERSWTVLRDCINSAWYPAASVTYSFLKEPFLSTPEKVIIVAIFVGIGSYLAHTLRCFFADAHALQNTDVARFISPPYHRMQATVVIHHRIPVQ